MKRFDYNVLIIHERRLITKIRLQSLVSCLPSSVPRVKTCIRGFSAIFLAEIVIRDLRAFRTHLHGFTMVSRRIR